MFFNTFDELYKEQIHSIFGKEFFKHALFFNLLLITFCSLCFILLHVAQQKIRDLNNQINAYGVVDT